MNKEFIPYEQTLELKELGFNETCFGKWFEYDAKKHLVRESELRDDWWQNNAFNLEVPAPLYQQAFRWFRENQGYYIDLFVDDDKTFGFCITYFTYTARVDKPIQRKFNTYEEAELACLKKLIEIVKNK